MSISGLTAAKALEDGPDHGFWANGMGTEVAVRRGVGTIVLDVRRGDGPKPCFSYTMSALATTDRLIGQSPRSPPPRCALWSRRRTRSRPMSACATEVGRKLFPPAEAELIAELIRRDLPYYNPSISPEFVAGMNQFARDIGILQRQVPYEKVVATSSPNSGAGKGKHAGA